VALPSSRISRLAVFHDFYRLHPAAPVRPPAAAVAEARPEVLAIALSASPRGMPAAGTNSTPSATQLIINEVVVAKAFRFRCSPNSRTLSENLGQRHQLGYTPEAEVGKYVLVHVGFAISVIDEAEAKRVFQFLEEPGGPKEELGENSSVNIATRRPPNNLRTRSAKE